MLIKKELGINYHNHIEIMRIMYTGADCMLRAAITLSNMGIVDDGAGIGYKILSLVDRALYNENYSVVDRGDFVEIKINIKEYT